MRRGSLRRPFLAGALTLAAITGVPAATTAPAAAPQAAAAPTAPSEAEAAAQVLALMKARLKLTPEQEGKIQPLVEPYVTHLRALFVEYTGSGASVLPSFLQEFNKTREDFRASLRPILNEPQRAELERLRKEVDESLRDMVVDQRVGALKGSLGLSAEQEAALRPIFRDDFEKKHQLLVLYAGPTGGPAARSWRADDMKKIQAETETKVRGVLTPDQMQTYLEDLNRKRTEAAARSGAR